MTFRPDPKKKTYENPKYLAYIREQPCLFCGKRAIAHHESGIGGNLAGGGMSLKCSDLLAVPLCCSSIDEYNYNACHQRRETEGYVTFWAVTVGGFYGIGYNNFKLQAVADGVAMREVLRLQMEWIERGCK